MSGGVRAGNNAEVLDSKNSTLVRGTNVIVRKRWLGWRVGEPDPI